MRVCIISHDRGEMAHQFQCYRNGKLDIVIFGKGIPGSLISLSTPSVIAIQWALQKKGYDKVSTKRRTKTV